MARTAATQSQTIFGEQQFPAAWQPDLSKFAGLNRSLQQYFGQAWKSAQELQLPRRKNEDWRWVDFSELGIENLQLWQSPKRPFLQSVSTNETSADYAGKLVMNENAVVLQLSDDLSSKGVVLSDLNTALVQHGKLVSDLSGKVINSDGNKLIAATSALANEGLFLYVPKGVNIEKPLLCEIGKSLSGQAVFNHSIIWLEEDSSCSLLLEFTSPQEQQNTDGLCLSVEEIHLGNGSSLSLCEVQEFQHSVWNISFEKAQLEKNAQLNWTYGALGSHMSKNFLTVDLNGEGAEAKLKGFYFPSTNQRLDLDTQQNHLAPKTISDLLYKGAATGNGKAIWEGMIYVDPQAQQTNGYQADRNLVLSEQADIKSIPGLEILANDVSCSHGATVGQLDEDELFYLQSRGIPLTEAEQMLVTGFYAEIVDTIPLEAERKRISREIIKKLDVSQLGLATN